MELITRPFDPGDLVDVIRIERASQPSAWTPAQLRGYVSRSNARMFIVESDGRTRGFFALQSFPSRLYILNLAVDPPFRRRGVATFMLAAIERRARTEACDVTELHVRESNLPAQLLYRSARFRAVEIRRRGYGNEDGYCMRRVTGDFA